MRLDHALAVRHAVGGIGRTSAPARAALRRAGSSSDSSRATSSPFTRRRPPPVPLALLKPSLLHGSMYELLQVAPAAELEGQHEGGLVRVHVQEPHNVGVVKLLGTGGQGVKGST